MAADAVAFSALLDAAITEPGRISSAYTAFHNYSLGNMLLALGQCEARGIPLGPIASFNRWKELGRHVSKGQKAIALCMPVTCKRKGETDEDDDATFTRFVYRNNWFALAQTEGADYVQPETPEWDKSRALAALDVTEIPFDLIDGNCQGYAKARTVAVSPVAAMPYKTLFHELAHVVLGHTSETTLSDDDRTPRNIREVEAEAVAMLVCAALNLPGVECSRGYIQHWNASGEPIPETSARKILKTADQILKAGQETA
jgi:antirestriction protein ArdC